MNTYMKILVVDDSAIQRDIIKEGLNRLGLKNIVEADDGETALAKLQKGKIDLVLSDWNMPVMDGLELLQNVRNDARLKRTPFIMVTLPDHKEKILQGVREGMNDYIVKPVTTRVLSNKLEKLFGNNGRQST